MAVVDYDANKGNYSFGIPTILGKVKIINVKGMTPERTNQNIRYLEQTGSELLDHAGPYAEKVGTGVQRAGEGIYNAGKGIAAPLEPVGEIAKTVGKLIPLAV